MTRIDPTAVDLLHLIMHSGTEGCQVEVSVPVNDFVLGAEIYCVANQPLDVTLNCSRVAGHAWALRSTFFVEITGRCMRCLDQAVLELALESHEAHSDDETQDDSFFSPYVTQDVLNLSSWVHDTILLELPAAILCAQDCRGLCPQCGENLNTGTCGHRV